MDPTLIAVYRFTAALLIGGGAAWWLGRRESCASDGQGCRDSACLARFLALAVLVAWPPTRLDQWPWELPDSLGVLLAIGVVLHGGRWRHPALQVAWTTAVTGGLLLTCFPWWNRGAEGWSTWGAALLAAALLAAVRPRLAALPAREQCWAWALPLALLPAIAQGSATATGMLAAAVLAVATGAGFVVATWRGAGRLLAAASLVPLLGIALLAATTHIRHTPDPGEPAWGGAARLVAYALLPLLPWLWLALRRGPRWLAPTVGILLVLGAAAAVLLAYDQIGSTAPDSGRSWDYGSL